MTLSQSVNSPLTYYGFNVSANLEEASGAENFLQMTPRHTDQPTVCLLNTQLYWPTSTHVSVAVFEFMRLAGSSVCRINHFFPLNVRYFFENWLHIPVATFFLNVWLSESVRAGMMAGFVKPVSEQPPARHFEKTERKKNCFPFCSSITCAWSRGLTLMARICGCFLNFMFTDYTATPGGIAATVASLYGEHSHVFVRC